MAVNGDAKSKTKERSRSPHRSRESRGGARGGRIDRGGVPRDSSRRGRVESQSRRNIPSHPPMQPIKPRNPDLVLLVLNLPYETTWLDLKEFCREKLGITVFTELLMDERGRNSGKGLLHLDKPENVKKALEVLNGLEIRGRKVTVKRYTPPRDNGGNRSFNEGPQVGFGPPQNHPPIREPHMSRWSGPDRPFQAQMEPDFRRDDCVFDGREEFMRPAGRLHVDRDDRRLGAPSNNIPSLIGSDLPLPIGLSSHGERLMNLGNERGLLGDDRVLGDRVLAMMSDRGHPLVEDRGRVMGAERDFGVRAVGEPIGLNFERSVERAAMERGREVANSAPTLVNERPPPVEHAPAGAIGVDWGNTFGLSVEFLNTLGIEPPLISKVSVSNLDVATTDTKIVEVFKLSGQINKVEMLRDQNGSPRGIAIIEFSHPVEAVQAISMFNNQHLFERVMVVRLDNKSEFVESLPSGLKGIGMGLGAGGKPLTNVALATSALNAPPSVGVSTNPTLGSMAVPNIDFVNNPPPTAQQPQAYNNTNMQSYQPSAQLGPNQPDTRNVFAGGYSNVDSFNGAGNGFQSNAPRAVGGTGFDWGAGGDGAYRNQQGGGVPAFDRGFSDFRGGQGAIENQYQAANLIVKNLPVHFTKRSLEGLFSEFGPVTFSQIRDRGIGLVRFVNDRQALRAANMLHNTRVDGRLIEVRLG